MVDLQRNLVKISEDLNVSTSESCATLLQNDMNGQNGTVTCIFDQTQLTQSEKCS